MLNQIRQWFGLYFDTKSGLLDLSALPPPKRPHNQTLATQRLVVLDLETTGLDTAKDQMIAIGAVAIEQLAIPLRNQFDLILRRPELDIRETVLIHGIGPEALTHGHETEDALLRLLHWMDGAPILAFHADFDRRFLERTLKTQLGYSASHLWLDVADILPAIFPESKVSRGRGRLDDWIDHFGLEISERHQAAADAMVTAELVLIALGYARKQDISTLTRLEEKISLGKRINEMKGH